MNTERTLGIVPTLVVAFALVIALNAISGFSVGTAITKLKQLLAHVTVTTEPISASAYEMEINTIGSGMAVFKYLHHPDPSFRQRFVKDQADFKRFHEAYLEHAGEPFKRGCAVTVGGRHSGTRPLAGKLHGNSNPESPR